MPDMPDEEPIRMPSPHARDAYKLAELEGQQARIWAAYHKQAPDNFMIFAKGLRIASQRGPKIFARVAAHFQIEAFETLAPNIEALRDGRMPSKRRFWWERTKKASKDADLAVVIAWLTAYARRPFYGQVGAANGEQAGIVKERLTVLLHWNEWLNDHIELVNDHIRSKHKMANGKPLAHWDIMRSDIAGAHGGTPDMLIVNELSHIQRWEFAENLMDNADGVAQGIVMVATNAGFKGTKAEVWRNTAITSDNWETHILAAPAPWHDKETIAEAKRRNPPGRYNRLWRGIWASGKGDALNEEDVDAVFRLRGPLLAPEKGWDYLVGLDLGISHDHAGVCVLGINTEQRKLKTAILRGWEPLGDPPEVDLIDVQSFVFAMNQLFRPLLVLYDPTEARLMAQQLRRKGVPMCEMTFSSTTNLTKMAESLIQVVEGHVLAAYDDPDGRLRRDFGKFNIVEKPYGYKLEAVSDEFGHADVGTALVICLPQAMDMLQGLAVLRPDDKLTYDEGGDLTDAEIASMDPELREIYEMDEKDHPAWDRDW